MPLKQFISSIILKSMSYLPLNVIRLFGVVLGFFMYFTSSKAILRTKKNLLLAKICSKDKVDQLAYLNALEVGKTILESMTIAWFRNVNYIQSLIVAQNGLDVVKIALQSGQPILFLTPHIGNFEIIVKAAVADFARDFTIMYKPPKQKWLNQIMLSGRKESNLHPVPTNSQGVRSLIKALKSGQIAGLLPDSVASQGSGTWVNFFAHKVFATTLAAKLATLKNVQTFIVGSSRVKNGFIIDYIPFHLNTLDPIQITQEIYKVMEQIILKNTLQYFWSYDRFRIPSHAR